MSVLHICIHGWGYHTCVHTLTHIPHAQAHIYPSSTSPIRYLIHESNVKTNQQHSPRQLKQAFPQPGCMTERELKYPPKPRLHASFILTRSRHDWLPICSAPLLSRRISRLFEGSLPPWVPYEPIQPVPTSASLKVILFALRECVQALERLADLPSATKHHQQQNQYHQTQYKLQSLSWQLTLAQRSIRYPVSA